MEKKRSVGIVVFGILCIFYPHLATYVFNSSPLRESSKTSITLIDWFLYYSLDSGLKISIYAIVSMVLFAGGLGILLLRTWARKLIVIFSRAVVILHLVIYSSIILCLIGGWRYYFGSSGLPSSFQIKEFLFGGLELGSLFLFNTGFFIILLLFLTRPKVKEQFK